MAQAILFAGGGIKRGQVIGATDKRAAYPTTEPYGVEDVICSIFHQLGIDTTKTYYTPLGRPVPIVNGVGGLADTVIDYTAGAPKRRGSRPIEGGTGFVLREYTPTALLEAVARAFAVFADRRSWQALQVAGMRRDFSWDRSAQEYVKIYERALAGAGG